MSTRPPFAKTIVANWIEANGFDGLYSDECSCALSDLVPCGDDFTRCTPGYKVFPPDVLGDFDFAIEPTKGVAT